MTDDNDEGKGITATIEISGKDEIQKLEKQLEEERIAKEDAIAKMELMADKAFSKAKKELGAPDYIENPEQLEAFKAEKQKHKQPATGKAPLSGEPFGEISHVKEYDSVSEMMEDLRQRADSVIPEVRAEAKEIQKKLLEKMAKDKKSHNFEFEVDLNRIIEQKKKQKKGDINWDSA
jgi:ribonuclease D